MSFSEYFPSAEKRDLEFDISSLNMAWFDTTLLNESYTYFLRYFHQYSDEEGIVLYEAEDLIERNLTFEANLYAPGYLLIGDDSGGVGFLLSIADGGIYSSGLGDLCPKYFKFISKEFDSWVRDNFR